MWVRIVCDCPSCGDDLENLGEEFEAMKDKEIKEVVCKQCGERIKVEASVEIEISQVYETKEKK